MRPLLFSRHDHVLLHIPPDIPNARALLNGAVRWMLFRIVVVIAIALAMGALVYAELTP